MEFRLSIFGIILLTCLATTQLGCKQRRAPSSDVLLIGGKAASKADYPATVALMQVDTMLKTSSFFCSAARIGPKIYLTAAHCVTRSDRGTIKQVMLKGAKLRFYFGENWKKDASNRNTIDVTIVRVAIHPTWKNRLTLNSRPQHNLEENLSDLAAFEITEDIPISAIGIANLADFELSPAVALQIGGYGAEQKNKRSDVNLNYGPTKILAMGDRYIRIPAEQLKLAHGDSGGPVYLGTNHGPFNVIVGVNSFGMTDDSYGGFVNLFPGNDDVGQWFDDLKDPSEFQIAHSMLENFQGKLNCTGKGANAEKMLALADNADNARTLSVQRSYGNTRLALLPLRARLLTRDKSILMHLYLVGDDERDNWIYVADNGTKQAILLTRTMDNVSMTLHEYQHRPEEVTELPPLASGICSNLN